MASPKPDIEKESDEVSDPWAAIWERKGKVDASVSGKEISGWEDHPIDFKKIVEKMLKVVQHKNGDSILEVGCGAGNLAQHCPKPYKGVDKAGSVINHLVNRPHDVEQADADALPFDDKSFDHVIVHSVFEYFPTKAYAHRVIKELERVARKAVWVGDIRTVGRASNPHKTTGLLVPAKKELEHLVFEKEEWLDAGYRCLESVHDNYGKPFDAVKMIKN